MSIHKTVQLQECPSALWPYQSPSSRGSAGLFQSDTLGKWPVEQQSTECNLRFFFKLFLSFISHLHLSLADLPAERTRQASKMARRRGVRSKPTPTLVIRQATDQSRNRFAGSLP